VVDNRFYIGREVYNEEKKGEVGLSFSQEYNNFENKYNTFYEDIYEEGTIYLPVSIFSSQMGSFQAIVKHLKEKEGLKYSKIAELTKRDQRTIWNTYNQIKKTTLKEEESVKDSSNTNVSIPLTIISDRKHSVLESIIVYLKDKGFSFNEIALMLKRNYQTIYTTHRKITSGGRKK